MKRTPFAAVAAFVAACACAAPVQAAEPGWDYNRPFLTADVSDCVYSSGGSTTGFAFNGAALTGLSFTKWPGCEHAGGSMRVLKIQRLTVAGRTTYMTRGGLADGVQFPGNTPHNHVSASALARQPDLVPHADRNGNGRAAPNCTGLFYVKPTSVPGDMLYKPGDWSGGSMWDNYGNPGARFGSSWTHAVWNTPYRQSGYYWEKIDGGGLIQSTLRHRQAAYNCDVDHQFLLTYAPGATTHNGLTEWAYARYSNGSETLYGWIMVAFWKNGDPKTLMFEWS